MSAFVYILGVFVLLVIWSAVSAISRRGAQTEIDVRGIAGVGSNTLKVADGTASTGEKISIVVATVLGSLVSPPFIIASAVIGGIIYGIVRAAGGA